MSDDEDVEDVETFIQNQQKKRKQELQQEVDRWDDISERYNNPDPLHKLLQERIDLLKTKNTKLQEQNETFCTIEEDFEKVRKQKTKLKEQNTSLQTQNDALYGELHETIKIAHNMASKMSPQNTTEEGRRLYGRGHFDLRVHNNIKMEEFQAWASKISKKFAQREKPKGVCTICLDKPLTHAVMPCGHKCMCGDCAAKLTSKVCPICKDEYITIGQIYEC